MTYFEKLLKEHPGIIYTNLDCTRIPCPHLFGYEKEDDRPDCNKVSCTTCWFRKMPETLDEKTKPVAIINMRDVCHKVVQCRAELMAGGFNSAEAYAIIDKLMPLLVNPVRDVTIGDVIEELNKEEEK